MKQPQQERDGQINRFTGENAIRIVTKMELTGSKDELDQHFCPLSPPFLSHHLMGTHIVHTQRQHSMDHTTASSIKGTDKTR